MELWLTMDECGTVKVFRSSVPVRGQRGWIGNEAIVFAPHEREGVVEEFELSWESEAVQIKLCALPTKEMFVAVKATTDIDDFDSRPIPD